MVFLLFLFLRPRYSYIEFIERKPTLKAEKTGSLCQYHLEGEPIESGSEYVKFRLVCKDGLVSQNTFSRLALKESTVGSLVATYKDVFGFESVDFEKRFECKVNSDANFVGFAYSLEAKDEVICVEK